MAKNQFFTSFLSILEYIFIDNLNINLPIAVLLGKRLSLYDLPETSYKKSLNLSHMRWAKNQYLAHNVFSEYFRVYVC